MNCGNTKLDRSGPEDLHVAVVCASARPRFDSTALASTTYFNRVLPAGDVLRPTFILNNTGNVPIRGLDLAGVGDIGNISCQPQATEVLPVGASMWCQGSVVLMSQHFDDNVTVFGHTWFSDNLVQSNNITTLYAEHTRLPPLGLESTASIVVDSFSCSQQQYYDYSYVTPSGKSAGGTPFQRLAMTSISLQRCACAQTGFDGCEAVASVLLSTTPQQASCTFCCCVQVAYHTQYHTSILPVTAT